MTVAILGFGTVGRGFYDLFEKNREKLVKKYGDEVKISKIYDIRKFDGLPMTSDIEELYASRPNIVVEAMGGTTHSYELVKNFLQRKTHVITSNKDLIAEHGMELIKIAKDNNVMLQFEASVGGGIPILKPIRENLSSNEILGITAILNGTTNFILSKMYNEDMNYLDALKEAQELGYAEKDPRSDVEGIDSARKLSILASMSFDEMIDYKSFKTIGITNIKKDEIEYAKENGYKIKLIAKACKYNDHIFASVRPTFVKNGSMFGNIDDSFNGISVNADAVGDLMFIGRGAGSLPTATSVYSDFEDILYQNENKHRYSEFAEKKLEGSKQIFLDPSPQSWMIVTNSETNKFVMVENTDELGVIDEIDALFLRGIKSTNYYPVMI